MLDSIPGLTTLAMLKGEVGDVQVASRARALAQFFDIYKGDLTASNTALLLINQVRDDIGGMPARGPNERIPGGRALKFYAWIIARVNPPAPIKGKGGEIVAKQFSVTVRKNKLAPAGRKAEFVVYLNGQNGPDVWGELARVGKLLGVFTREDGVTPADKGYWYFEGEKLAVGEAKVTEMLEADPDLAEQVAAAIRTALDNPVQRMLPAEADDAVEE